jgi:hypothetical protein
MEPSTVMTLALNDTPMVEPLSPNVTPDVER